MNFLKAMFGNYSKREVKRVQPICDKVLALEDKYAAMSESELKNQTTILKERLANGETTDDILPEAFATCREAGWRVLGMKHFPVQIIGGIVLHQGRIAEMKTGEGKTLVATLPAYLNVAAGRGHRPGCGVCRLRHPQGRAAEGPGDKGRRMGAGEQRL